MTHLSTGNLIAATGGTAVVTGDRAITAGVTTDSRAIAPGCVFVALCGERFDGNCFAADASQKGAAAVVVSRVEGEYAPGCTVVLVQDTLEALQRLAAWWRGQLEPLAVVGLTGSSGKTSTKDMCLSVLSQKFRALATKGNLNNHIGVPLSILSTPEGTEAAIWEMGMNHAGELAPLCGMTRPRIGIITTIGSAHMEYLGSREAIAEEKCTVARALPADGYMIYPVHDDFADYIAGQTTGTPLPVGENCSVRALNPRSTATGTTYTLHIDALGEIEIALPVPGAHMVSNSLLAAAAGWKLGCSLEQIAAGLSAASLTHGRLACKQADGCTVVDDTYNANPESMKAALETVAALKDARRAIAVLGKMGELGESGIAAHADMGRCAAELGYAAVVVVGAACAETEAMCAAAAAQIPAYRVDTPAEAAEILKTLMQPGDALLFKGSRSAGMERTMYELFPSLNPKHS